jgi:hypothetical protein
MSGRNRPATRARRCRARRSEALGMEAVECRPVRRADSPKHFVHHDTTTQSTLLDAAHCYLQRLRPRHRLAALCSHCGAD